MPVVSRPRTRSEGVDGARHPGRAVRAAVINASPAGIEAANAASRRVPVRSAPAETEQFSVAASMVSGSPLIAGRHRPRLRRDPAPASQEPRGHSLTELIMRLVPPSRSRRSRSTPTPSGASETGRAGGPVHATRIARAGAGRHWAAGGRRPAPPGRGHRRRPRRGRYLVDPPQAGIASIPRCSRMLACTWAGGPVASTAATTSLARNRSRTGRVLAW
jgi:hypothetical protein